VHNKKGEIVHTLYNNFLKEEPGRSPYVIGFAVDITDRIQAEKELKIAQKATEELAQTKQNFLTNMSHEIRTPMNAIMGMSNQLSKTKLSSQQEFYLDTIHTAADNLLVIINDILDLAKIEAGKLSIEEIAFEPQKVITGAIRVLMHKAEEKGIQLTNSLYDKKMSEVLIGDPHRLNQVLLNLLSNAIKFTDIGTVDLKCEVVEDTRASQIVKVKVIDTGVGMDESFVKNLFEKFNQEDISVSRKYGGTGLGMSITKQLVQLMGGKIEVTSEKNEGTTVTFEIEFSKGSSKQLQTPDSSHISSMIISGKKILVVDDNEMNRLVASTILQNYNADILEAENGEQAVALVSAQNPSVVLMDLQMPILNGIDATRRIRNMGSKVPIIALTANAIKGENEKCFDAGMNDYISKPYTEKELILKLVRWLDAQKPAELIADGDRLENLHADDKLYDLSGLEAISRGNQSFINKMVNMFCEQTPGMVRQMKESLNTDNLKKMSDIAHKMKPSIDNLKINSLKEDIRYIEKGYKDNLPKSQLADKLKKIENITNHVIQKMRQ
jgi:signal transduction histidine kinase/response regulator of citrate/malate metabolism